MPLVTSGVEHGNLRELALARMKDLGTEVCTYVRMTVHMYSVSVPMSGHIRMSLCIYLGIYVSGHILYIHRYLCICLGICISGHVHVCM